MQLLVVFMFNRSKIDDSKDDLNCAGAGTNWFR